MHAQRILDRLAQLEREPAWLSRRTGMHHSTLSRRLRRDNWSPEELDRIYLVLQMDRPAQREQGVAA